jgi:glycosyltransferase involved in cell wall biosynthesis
MRIALLSWESLHSVAVGGVAVHVTELAAALERRGHEIHVFTRRGYGQSDHDRIHGVHYHRCDYSPSCDFVDEMSNMCQSFAARLKCVEGDSQTFEIVHAHDWLASGGLERLGKSRSRSLVLTMHSTEYGRGGNTWGGGQSERIATLEQEAVRVADRLIAVSNHLQREVCRLYEVEPAVVDIIHNGVNSDSFDYLVDAGEVKRRYKVGCLDPTVLFVGRLVVQKGPDILMGAIPIVLDAHSHAKFVFVGHGDLWQKLIQMSDDLRIGHALRLLGDVRGKSLNDLFLACDVLVVPSRNEPFGIVALEGWSAGKPIVVTKSGGIAELVRTGVTGLLAEAIPSSIARSIVALFADHAWARQMGWNGRRYVRSAEFHWDTVAERTEQIYLSLQLATRERRAKIGH